MMDAEYRLTWLVTAINKTVDNVKKKHCKVFLKLTMKYRMDMNTVG